MKTPYQLLFADGPTPPSPEDARTLGYEMRQVEQLMVWGHAGLHIERGDAFRTYVHRASLPELCAMVRAMGRDCTFELFAECQAILFVAAAP